ncbi:unnamed protein product [Paramecium primaurelia]|uniref:Uncharacterized protein n=1 Tax=Paramecium primaurelia TaxID=5886 RepID=A0A8S1QP03_PARPR|nr:unnamed protein product [Paramecium primaurelia]
MEKRNLGLLERIIKKLKTKSLVNKSSLWHVLILPFFKNRSSLLMQAQWFQQKRNHLDQQAFKIDQLNSGQ